MTDSTVPHPGQPMRLCVGRIACGVSYWPRPKVTSDLIRISERSDASFLGPRRTGKSSQLWHLRDHYSTDERKYLFLNLELFDSAEQWLSHLIAEVDGLIPAEGRWDQFKKRSGSFRKHLAKLRQVKIGGVEISMEDGATWRDIGREFMGLLGDLPFGITFLLDEFPYLVRLLAERSPEEGAALLHWFRACRQHAAADPVRFIVTGSIGLNSVARRYRLDKSINDFEPYHLSPISREEAAEMATRLAADNDIAIDDEALEYILDRVGPVWPFFVQLLLTSIQDLGLPAGESPDTATLDQLYEERLLNEVYNTYLQSMWSRLPDHFDDDELRASRAILGACAKKSESLDRDTLREGFDRSVPDEARRLDERFRYILDVLIHDGYLTESSEGRFAFASPLLKEFWLRKTR